ncbi:uncharacterized protein B0I36DRAFT_348254 [Microdochium trichocladiopsis]|uniref:Uncharacterized protein n=1 Tax=Microdochium trichocladiopsis TaxID=1682393 RepID=A0A9P8YBI4_9PEZI|nr:uncharacterized protein B0I36DRAFT_348254 [Microdochium trichocladiopsis]KAH7033157.1 hypothetical protein B0I36DRAFT_348254 [Microdochium trichocladiopsis]
MDPGNGRTTRSSGASKRKLDETKDGQTPAKKKATPRPKRARMEGEDEVEHKSELSSPSPPSPSNGDDDDTGPGGGGGGGVASDSSRKRENEKKESRTVTTRLERVPQYQSTDTAYGGTQPEDANFFPEPADQNTLPSATAHHHPPPPPPPPPPPATANTPAQPASLTVPPSSTSNNEAAVVDPYATPWQGNRGPAPFNPDDPRRPPRFPPWNELRNPPSQQTNDLTLPPLRNSPLGPQPSRSGQVEQQPQTTTTTNTTTPSTSAAAKRPRSESASGSSQDVKGKGHAEGEDSHDATPPLQRSSKKARFDESAKSHDGKSPSKDKGESSDKDNSPPPPYIPSRPDATAQRQAQNAIRHTSRRGRGRGSSRGGARTPTRPNLTTALTETPQERVSRPPPSSQGSPATPGEDTLLREFAALSSPAAASTPARRPPRATSNDDSSAAGSPDTSVDNIINNVRDNVPAPAASSRQGQAAAQAPRNSDPFRDLFEEATRTHEELKNVREELARERKARKKLESTHGIERAAAMANNEKLEELSKKVHESEEADRKRRKAEEAEEESKAADEAIIKLQRDDIERLKAEMATLRQDLAAERRQQANLQELVAMMHAQTGSEPLPGDFATPGDDPTMGSQRDAPLQAVVAIMQAETGTEPLPTEESEIMSETFFDQATSEAGLEDLDGSSDENHSHPSDEGRSQGRDDPEPRGHGGHGGPGAPPGGGDDDDDDEDDDRDNGRRGGGGPPGGGDDGSDDDGDDGDDGDGGDGEQIADDVSITSEEARQAQLGTVQLTQRRLVINVLKLRRKLENVEQERAAAVARAVAYKGQVHAGADEFIELGHLRHILGEQPSEQQMLAMLRDLDQMIQHLAAKLDLADEDRRAGISPKFQALAAEVCSDWKDFHNAGRMQNIIHAVLWKHLQDNLFDNSFRYWGKQFESYLTKMLTHQEAKEVTVPDPTGLEPHEFIEKHDPSFPKANFCRSLLTQLLHDREPEPKAYSTLIGTVNSLLSSISKEKRSLKLDIKKEATALVGKAVQVMVVLTTARAHYKLVRVSPFEDSATRGGRLEFDSWWMVKKANNATGKTGVDVMMCPALVRTGPINGFNGDYTLKYVSASSGVTAEGGVVGPFAENDDQISDGNEVFVDAPETQDGPGQAEKEDVQMEDHVEETPAPVRRSTRARKPRKFF